MCRPKAGKKCARMGVCICRTLGNIFPGGQAEWMRGVPRRPRGEKCAPREGEPRSGLQAEGGGGGSRGPGAEYLGVEDIAGDPAEHEQPVFLYGPGDAQPGHPLQGALVCLVVVAQAPAFLLGGLF